MKIVNILPRQSRKTTTILNLFMEDRENTVILVPTDRYKDDIIQTFTNFYDGHLRSELRTNIITPNQAETWYRGKRINRILIDELFYIDKRAFIRFRENLQFVNGGIADYDIIAFSTMKEQIESDFLNIIKEHKALGGQLEDLYDETSDYENIEVDYWYHNFITDLDCTIVIGPSKLDYMDNPKYVTESLNMPFI